MSNQLIILGLVSISGQKLIDLRACASFAGLAAIMTKATPFLPALSPSNAGRSHGQLAASTAHHPFFHPLACLR
jgi:hypothetical protein